MVTLSQINQYAMDNNLSDDTDVFTILSQMQLEYKEVQNLRMASNTSFSPPASQTDNQTEYSIQDVLELFNS